jgi:DNA polymerase-3 subunit alpha
MGVFQLESSGMQNLCVRMKPDRLDDLAAVNGLYRPGPLESGMVDDFIARKQGKANVETLFPEMKEVLSDTYGVIVYQEQVMELARVIAGYSLGGADLLRRAMGKKIAEEMEAQRSIFVEGATKLGRDPRKSSELFDLIAKFAGYGFNKSHASAYATLSVQTSFLKAVYPVEFFTALLTIEKENTDKLARYIQDAKRRNLKILPPDVNSSESDFKCVDDKTIRFGLSAIRNVGESATEVILEARKKGPFKDLWDFLSRVDTRKINKRVVESLIHLF